METDLPQRLKISPFAHVLRRGNNVAVYNSMNQKLFFSDKSLVQFLDKFKEPHETSKIKQREMTKKLFDSKILIGDGFNPDTLLEKIRKVATSKPSIESLYIVTTDECNYACKYCFVEGNMPENYAPSMMSQETARRGIELFLESKNEEAKSSEIVFYGGEPLLNKEIIRFSNELLDENVKNGRINKLNKMIYTNGSLVSQDIANFFHNSNISVGISIDGWKEIHDKMRVFKMGGGTFERTMAGYDIMKRTGCEIGISCTVSMHNIEILPDVVEYFASKLDAKFMSLNPLFDIPGVNKNPQVFLKKMSEKIIQAYDKAKSLGIYEDRVSKFIEPFVRGYIRTCDCAGCGRQIVLSPEGEIGVCHAFLGNKKYFCGSVYDKKTQPNKSEIFMEWSRRSPFNMPDCYKCKALSICGGGCPYNAYIRNGSVWKIDDRTCALANGVLEKIIWESFGSKELKHGHKGHREAGKNELRLFGC